MQVQHIKDPVDGENNNRLYIRVRHIIENTLEIYETQEIKNLSIEEGKSIGEALKLNTNVQCLEIKLKNLSIPCAEYLIDSLKTNTDIY
ncbi:unnamed protein product, partial [Didymodactylos carnosus]